MVTVGPGAVTVCAGAVAVEADAVTVEGGAVTVEAGAVTVVVTLRGRSPSTSAQTLMNFRRLPPWRRI